jgi:SPP1 gp7 family putative phage head morphogenesis protein
MKVVQKTLNGVSNKVKFNEAIDYMRNKIDLPTESYRDIKASAHKKAFVIAGLANMDILADFHKRITDSVENGTPFSQFKKEFRDKAASSGWLSGEKADKKYTAWRAKVIWETNVTQAYHAGRWERYASPESVEDYPYLEFRHNFYGISIEPRESHVALNGLIFPVGDAFWDNHFGMLNYGCKCGVTRVARWDERVKDKSESDILSENRTIAGYDEKRGEYPDNGSDGNFVNPGVFDGGGIVSLFDKIDKMQKSGGWRKELADKTWDCVADNNKIFADNLKTWIDRLWTGKEVKSRETRSIAVLSREKFEEIRKEYESKKTKNMPEKLLKSPVIFCNGSQLSHAGRIEKGRTPIDKSELYLLSELNKAKFEIDVRNENLPRIEFFVKNKIGKTIKIIVKDFKKFTDNTKNSSIITFFYADK